MLYGFILIYLRDFAPGKETWIADYAVGMYFKSRLAPVHGNQPGSGQVLLIDTLFCPELASHP